MNPELTYTLELSRVLESCVDRASASQERAGADLAFDRSLRRGREAIISMLQKACSELAPTDGEQIGKLIRVLEYGEVPAPQISNEESRNGGNGISDIEGKAATGSGEQAGKRTSFKAGNSEPKRSSRPVAAIKKRLISGAQGSSFPDSFSPVDPRLPSDEKSREVMAQWR